MSDVRDTIVKIWIAFTACFTVSGQAGDALFQDVSNGYVPFGKPAFRRTMARVQQCQVVCAQDPACKAFAFSEKRMCYVYRRVYNGGETTKLSRQMWFYSAGLAIVPKSGFVSSFKTSSFPPRPVMIDPTAPRE